MLNNWNILFWEYDFLSPHWLWLLLFVPVFIYLMWKNEKKKSGEVKFSRTDAEQNQLKSVWISDVRKIFIVVYAFVLVLLIVALELC